MRLFVSGSEASLQGKQLFDTLQVRRSVESLLRSWCGPFSISVDVLAR